MPDTHPLPDGAPPHTRPDRNLKTDAHAHGPHDGPIKPTHLRLVGLVILIAAGCSAAWGIVSRHQQDRSLADWTNQQAEPTVAVAHPTTSGAARALTLPGDVQAFYEAPIYARVNGYLRSWTQDIGAHVKAGQVLATIDAPELEQELAQAEADLASARANASLASLTASRWHDLLATKSVSQQSADEKQGSEVATQAAVHAQQAHVDRLRALETFTRLTAPFDGVVTARNTDVGALINAGSSAAQPLFKVADVHAVRVYVRVPQVYLSQLAPGMHATLTQPQYPGQTFPATLATTAQSAAAESRTVLVELMADNKDGKLWPGTYADVRFDLPPDAGVLRVPSSALVFRAQGAQLAVVGPGNHITLKSITIGRNLGNELEITSGITADDQVIVSPLDTMQDGQKVQLAAAALEDAAPGNGSQAP